MTILAAGRPIKDYTPKSGVRAAGARQRLRGVPARDRAVIAERTVAPRKRACGAAPSAASAWLERFHDPAVPKALAGTAFIPEVTDPLHSLWQVHQALPDCIQTHRPAATATLDMDATLIEAHKARRFALLTEVQGLSAAELLVVRTRCGAVLGVPRRECSARPQATAGASSIHPSSLSSRRFRGRWLCHLPVDASVPAQIASHQEPDQPLEEYAAMLVHVWTAPWMQE